MSVPLTEPSSLRVALGAGIGLDFNLPLLAGEPEERLFPSARALRGDGDVQLFETEGWRLGVVSQPLPTEAPLEPLVEQVYRQILQVTGGFHLARIWNYIPRINDDGSDGLENYRSFCRGRAQAFEHHFGPAYKSHLPAASAVGCPPPALAVIFAASATMPRHIENPLQVPAYEYPPEHGPRAPSFARATIVPSAHQPSVFISGTAAIRGHATVAPDSTAEQLACTLGNLREISLACGLGPDLAAVPGNRRHFKIYVRHADEHPAIAAYLNTHLLQPGDSVSYLLSDICRRPLNVEIEASLLPARSP